MSKQPSLLRSYASISAADLKFGQPLHETHPHLLNPGECVYMLPIACECDTTKNERINLKLVTPGITALEYAQRRSRLANKLPKNAIAVLAASEVTYRATGIFNNYRQDSNFFYLTGMLSLQVENKASSSLDILSIGFNEPNALAIIGKTGLPVKRLR